MASIEWGDRAVECGTVLPHFERVPSIVTVETPQPNAKIHVVDVLATCTEMAFKEPEQFRFLVENPVEYEHCFFKAAHRTIDVNDDKVILMTTIEIEASDVVRLIEQYLKENNLMRTLATLQEETNITLNTVDSIDAFTSEITQGHWDTVLKIIQPLKLPAKKLIDLYEQMIFELVELRELATACLIARQTDPMKNMDNDRYVRIESLINRPYFDGAEVYGEVSKEKRRQNIAQAQDNLMMMDSPVLSLVFSRNSEMLASGDSQGKIKVWKIQTGDCLRRFDKAHNKGVTVVRFSRDNSHVLSGGGGDDGVIRVHGLKSGKCLKEMKGHGSFITDAHYLEDFHQAVSSSADETCKVWNLKTMDCLTTFRVAADISVNSIHPIPKTDQLVVCNRSNTLYIVNVQGQIVRLMTSGKRDKGEIVVSTLSPRGEWMYAVAEDGVLYCFQVMSCTLESTFPVTDRPALGIAHHPHH